MTWSVSTYCDSSTTAVSGWSARMAAAATIPSVVWVGGIRMSTTATSGRSSATRPSRVAASPASPTTSIPSSHSSRAIPSRSSTESSASTTRRGAALSPRRVARRVAATLLGDAVSTATVRARVSSAAGAGTVVVVSEVRAFRAAAVSSLQVS